MMRVIYLLYFWLIFAPVFLLLTALTALITIAGCLLGGERVFAYYPGMFWSRLTCRLALCPVKVYGREHIPHNQSCIFASNHQSAFDIFLIYGFLDVPIKWMIKPGVNKLPFVGAACRAAGFIFVDKSSPVAATRSIKEAEQALKKGASIAIFPEGTRTRTGKMARFKKGAFVMAADRRLPVVPITLNGTFNVLPYGKITAKRHRMEIIIHPPIPTDAMEQGNKGLKQIADQTREVITSALWEEYRSCEP